MNAIEHFLLQYFGSSRLVHAGNFENLCRVDPSAKHHTLDGTNDATRDGRERLASRKHASLQKYLGSWLQIREPTTAMSNTSFYSKTGRENVLQNKH